MRNIHLSVAKAFVATMMIALMAAPAFAAEKATPQEVVQKVKEAVNLIKEKGAETALAIIRDKNGPFVWKDSYVVVTTMNGKMLAHPYVPKLEGREMARAKDAKGKLFQAELDNLVKKNGSGWIEFWWVKPNEKTPSRKVTFGMAVPGEDIMCNAGVYDLSLKEVQGMM